MCLSSYYRPGSLGGPKYHLTPYVHIQTHHFCYVPHPPGKYTSFLKSPLSGNDTTYPPASCLRHTWTLFLYLSSFPTPVKIDQHISGIHWPQSALHDILQLKAIIISFKDIVSYLQSSYTTDPDRLSMHHTIVKGIFLKIKSDYEV